jgi:Na+-driven multidrug efflux pump
MNQKIKILGKEITIRKPEPYADIRDMLMAWSIGLAVIMLTISFTFSWFWAYLFLREYGADMEKLNPSFEWWFRIPITFLSLVTLTLISAALDEAKKKREKERYSKPPI